MKTHPMLFKAPEVRALWDGRKTQTRRFLKLRGMHPDYRGPAGCMDDPDCWGWESDDGQHIGIAPATDDGHDEYWSGPYAPGDLIWCRETWAPRIDRDGNADPRERYVKYRASCPAGTPANDEMDWHSYEDRWRPSTHMPRWASRLTLRVTDVRVQRVQDITDDDAIAEGLGPLVHPLGRQDLLWVGRSERVCQAPGRAFLDLWNSINGPDAWDRNDWVTALTFDVIKDNIDTVLRDET